RASGLLAVAEWLDRRLRTEQIERLDDPRVSEERKVAEVNALHRQNRYVGVYPFFVRLLSPYVEWSRAHNGGGPVRVLELAAGSGDFSRFLAEYSKRKSAGIEVTCTDVVEKAVDQAAARARGQDLPLRFERL